MPSRKEPLVNGSYYHIYNKTYQYTPFMDERLCRRSLFSFWYLNHKHSISLTNYLKASVIIQQKQRENFQKFGMKVDLFAFSLMPNHFHLLLKQNVDNGISKFVGDFQNSITQYFNKKNTSLGPLFQRQFKASLIKNQEHLLHVSRYIHLNQYSAKMVHTMGDLTQLQTNSLSIYMGNQENVHNFLQNELLDNLFSSREKHYEFVNDHKDYKRSLSGLSQLYLDNEISPSEGVQL